MAIELTDDGTLDTVLRCTECGEEFRFNYSESAPEDVETDTEALYESWLQGCIAETEAEHTCNICEVCGEALPSNWDETDGRICEQCWRNQNEPQDDDITSSDGRTFYQNGKKIVQPNAYTHGGADTESFCYLMPGKNHYVGCYQTAEAALLTYMGKAQFWPNVWIISDHGNASLMTWSE